MKGHLLVLLNTAILQFFNAKVFKKVSWHL